MGDCFCAGAGDMKGSPDEIGTCAYFTRKSADAVPIKHQLPLDTESKR